MKKKLLVLTLIVCLIAINSAAVLSASAMSVDECDRVFTESVRSFMEDQGYASQTVAADKEMLYDVDLSELGVIYYFNVDNKPSYAIVIEHDGVYVMTECFFGAQDPYAGGSGKNIYVNQSLYLDYLAEKYYIIGEESSLSAEAVELLSEKAYKGSGSFTTSTSTVNYAYKNQTSFLMVLRHPRYTEVGGLQSACAPIAAGNIVGYFDRYSTNLIPNYTPGINMGTNYLYSSQNDAVNNMIRTLYEEMGTTASQGTTADQFKEGLTKYCNDQGYNISISSAMSWGSLNYSYCKSQMDANKPIVLFLSRYNVSLIMQETNKDELETLNGTGNHVMAGFGYLDINYTFSNNTTQNARYIAVASGLTAFEAGYYNIDLDTSINDAYSINIY